MWVVVVRNAAEKQLNRLPKPTRTKIVSVLGELSNNPFAGDISQLHDNIWRRRVGSYRITFEIIKSQKIIYVM